VGSNPTLSIKMAVSSARAESEVLRIGLGSPSALFCCLLTDRRRLIE
jgi:hypothetical protein